MGKAVAAMAVERGHSIHTVVDSSENAGGRALTRERLAGVDVAIEFTRPEAAIANLERLIELGIPTVMRDDRMDRSPAPDHGLGRSPEGSPAPCGQLLGRACISFSSAACELARNFRWTFRVRCFDT